MLDLGCVFRTTDEAWVFFLPRTGQARAFLCLRACSGTTYLSKNGHTYIATNVMELVWLSLITFRLMGSRTESSHGPRTKKSGPGFLAVPFKCTFTSSLQILSFRLLWDSPLHNSYVRNELLLKGVLKG